MISVFQTLLAQNPTQKHKTEQKRLHFTVTLLARAPSNM